MAELAGKAEVVLSDRVAKKNSVRFTTKDDDAPLHDLYVPKATLVSLGLLEGGAIKVTIEPA